MMTNNSTLRRRIRISAGVFLLTAGAGLNGVLGATPTANAADAYVALSVGLANDNPPVRTIGGMAIGPDADQARIASLSNCQNNGGNQCVFEMSAKNECAAAAANDYGQIEAASDPSVQAAETSAMGKLQNSQGSHVVVSGCSNGQVQPPPPDQPPPPNQPPPAPTQGPTVSFKTIVGGRQAHITDRSGVSSQCTYTADDYNRSFALPANSSYDLKIVPAVPQFRNWNITIACDNGTSTQTTDYF
jgi:hypothetical protein